VVVGKEVKTTLRQKVGKNFLAKYNLVREIRVSGAAREMVRTSACAGCAYELTKREMKIPFARGKHNKKRPSPEGLAGRPPAGCAAGSRAGPASTVPAPPRNCN
jgi:hypothetical protein